MPISDSPFPSQHLDIVPKEENKAFLTFVIPHDREALLTVINPISFSGSSKTVFLNVEKNGETVLEMLLQVL